MPEDDALQFEYGDPKKPRGSAFAYWRLDIESAKFERIIAANFVISPLFLGPHSVAATFPPQVMDTHEQLLAIARRAKIDLILVDEIRLLQGGLDFQDFFKKQLARFNQVVAAYLKYYIDSLQDAGGEGAPEGGEIESIRDIKRLSQEARKSFLVHQNSAQARQTLIRIRKIANTLNSPTRKYDVEDLLVLLSNPDERVEELTRLYHKKFIAICTEHYEDAEQLKRAISHLSRSISLEAPFHDSEPEE